MRIQVDCAWGPGSQKLLPDFFHPPGHILEGLFLEILDCQPEPETEAQGQFIPGAPSVAALLDVVPELTSHGILCAPAVSVATSQVMKAAGAAENTKVLHHCTKCMLEDRLASGYQKEIFLYLMVFQPQYC